MILDFEDVESMYTKEFVDRCVQGEIEAHNERLTDYLKIDMKELHKRFGIDDCGDHWDKLLND